MKDMRDQDHAESSRVPTKKGSCKMKDHDNERIMISPR